MSTVTDPTTKVINIEDTMPYVEPVKLKTPADLFKEALVEAAEVELDSAVYYRGRKDWGKAALHQRTATELERICRTADPAREIEDSMNRAIRLYADLKIALGDAHNHTVWGMKKQARALEEAGLNRKEPEAPAAPAKAITARTAPAARQAPAKPVNGPKARSPRVRRGTGTK